MKRIALVCSLTLGLFPLACKSRESTSYSKSIVSNSPEDGIATKDTRVYSVKPNAAGTVFLIRSSCIDGKPITEITCGENASFLERDMVYRLWDKEAKNSSHKTNGDSLFAELKADKQRVDTKLQELGKLQSEGPLDGESAHAPFLRARSKQLQNLIDRIEAQAAEEKTKQEQADAKKQAEAPQYDVDALRLLKVLLEDRELVPLPTEPTGAQFAGSENVAQLGKNVSELNKFKAMMDQVIDKFSVPFLLSQSKLPYIVNSAKSGNIWIRLGAQSDNLLASKACREAGESAQLDFRLPTVEQAAAEVNLLHTSDVGSVVDNGWLSAKAWAAWINSKTARDGRIFWVLDPKIGAGGKFDVGTSTWIDSRVGSADVVCVYDRSKKVVAGSN